MSRSFGRIFLNNAAREASAEVRDLLRDALGSSPGSQLRGAARRSSASSQGFLDGLISAFTSRHHPALDRLRRAIGGTLSNRDIARELLRGAGVLDQPRAPDGAGRGGGRGGRIGGGLLEPEGSPEPGRLQPVGRRRQGAKDAPPLPGEESPYGQEILTPQSSNVFSFSYAAETSTLYVTFKANRLNPDSVRTGKGRRGGMNQLRGKLGATVSGKTNERGPMYAYLDVPARVYQRMQLAHSKGRFVWDELRIRGTIYGHKYRYQLVQGQVVTQRGVSGVYVPRKATREGFRVRSVATLGEGRRRFESSTLPEQIGFRSRRPPGR